MKPPKCICIDNLAFSLQNIHVSFLRTVPPYSHQVRSDNNDQNNDQDDDDCSKADVWVELLQHFHYRQLVFIHSSDTDGRSLLGRLVVHPKTLKLKYQMLKVVVAGQVGYCAYLGFRQEPKISRQMTRY